MSDLVQLPPVNSDNDGQSGLSIKPVRASGSQSDSQEFNKVLTKQSDRLEKNSNAANNSTRVANTDNKPADPEKLVTDDKLPAEQLANSGNTTDTGGNTLPAGDPVIESAEILQTDNLPVLLTPTDGVDSEQVTSATTAVPDDNPPSLQSYTISSATDVAAHDEAVANNIDVANEAILPASPVILDADSEATSQPAIASTQARQPEHVRHFLDTRLNVPSGQQINKEKTIGFIETSPGLSNAVEKQPVLPTQANAVLRNFLNTTADQNEAAVANIRLREGTEVVQRTLLFEQLTGVAPALRQAATQTASSLLNFTATTPLEADAPLTPLTDVSTRLVQTPVGLTNPETGLSNVTGTVRPALELPMQHSQWGQELGNKVSWLINHRLSEAQIRLNPQELGPIEVRIQVHQDSATVNFSTHNQGVKESIEAAIPRLREALAEQGLDLVDVNVSQQDAGGDYGEQPGFSADGGNTKDAVTPIVENPDEQIFTADLSESDERIDFYA